MDVNENNIGIVGIKTTEQMEKLRLIPSEESRDYPKYFNHGVVIILEDDKAAVEFVKNHLVPNIKEEKLHRIFKVRTTEAEDAHTALNRILGLVNSSKARVWLIFQEVGFNEEILPILIEIGLIKT